MTTIQIQSVNNKAYIKKKDLAKLLGVSQNQISNYEREDRYNTPLERVGEEEVKELGLKGVYYYPFKSIKWYLDNVKTKHSSKKTNSIIKNDMKIDNIDTDDLDTILSRLPSDLKIAFQNSEKDILDKFSALEDINKKRLENQIKRGDYIKKIDSDRATSVMAKMMLSSLTELRENLPTTLISLGVDLPIATLENAIDIYLEKMVDELREKVEQEEESTDDGW